MALREEFENVGNWLFRWRSYLPLAIIVLYLLALLKCDYTAQSSVWDPLWEIASLLVCFLGLGIRIFTISYTPRGTSGRNTRKQVAETLNTTGIYSIVRNPLYLGNFFIGLGMTIFSHIWWLILVYILLFSLYYERIIFAEEAFLRKKFGESYIDWSNRTPAIIPRFRQYQRANLPFSMRKALKREDNSFFTIIITLFILETINNLFMHRRLEFDKEWIIILSTGFIIWSTLRILRKRTKVLRVEGR